MTKKLILNQHWGVSHDKKLAQNVFFLQETHELVNTKNCSNVSITYHQKY